MFRVCNTEHSVQPAGLLAGLPHILNPDIMPYRRNLSRRSPSPRMKAAAYKLLRALGVTGRRYPARRRYYLRRSFY